MRSTRVAKLTLLSCTALAACADDTMLPTAATEAVAPPQFALIGTRAFLTGTLSQVTTNPAPQFNPSISGDPVVYTDRRDRNDDIYFTDLATGLEVGVTSDALDQRLHDVSDGRIVFTDLSTTEPQIRIHDGWPERPRSPHRSPPNCNSIPSSMATSSRSSFCTTPISPTSSSWISPPARARCSRNSRGTRGARR